MSHTFTCLYIPLHPHIITPKSAVVGAAAFVRLVPPPLFRCLWMRLPMSKSLHVQLMYACMHLNLCNRYFPCIFGTNHIFEPVWYAHQSRHLLFYFVKYTYIYICKPPHSAFLCMFDQSSNPPWNPWFSMEMLQKHLQVIWHLAKQWNTQSI